MAPIAKCPLGGPREQLCLDGFSPRGHQSNEAANKHDYLVLELMTHLLIPQDSAVLSQLKSQSEQLEAELDRGQSLVRAYPKHPFPALTSQLTEQLLALSAQKDPTLFLHHLKFLGQNFKSQGKYREAALIFQFIAQFKEDKNFAGPALPDIQKYAKDQLDLITGTNQRNGLGRRLEFFMENQSWFSKGTQLVNQGGAILGLGTMICSLIPSLRPLAASGIRFLSNPRVAATLYIAGGLSLYEHYPQFSDAVGRLWNRTSQEKGSTAWSDRLLVGSYLLGGLGIGVGVASFGLYGKTFFQTRRLALAEGHTPFRALQISSARADAVRRAVQDPELWVQFARSYPKLTMGQRNALAQLGRWTDRLFWGGAALIGGGHLLQESQREQSWDGWFFSLLNFSLDVYPAVTIGLYRAGRGHRHYDLGPAMSQELLEPHYMNSKLRSRVLDRLESGIHPLTPSEEMSFLNSSRDSLGIVGRLLQDAQGLPALTKNPRKTETIPLPKMETIFPKPQRAVRFLPSAAKPHQRGPHYLEKFSNFSLTEIRQAYLNGEVSPLGVLHEIRNHPAIKNGAIFPRSLTKGGLAGLIYQRAFDSTHRFQHEPATVRPLEGVFIAVKDIFAGMDGKAYVGSKTLRLAGNGPSPVVNRLLELGAIPIPVGMVAAANGGSGMHAGFGYVPHPTRPGFDPAGSSSGTAHVVGLKDFPIGVGIGTDTGGSVIAPAGAVGLTGFVPAKGTISTKNMVPFDTNLDRVGVLTRHSDDAFHLARLLGTEVPKGNHTSFASSSQPPDIVYLRSSVSAASEPARKHFRQKVDQLRSEGYQVTELGAEWNFLTEVPLQLYPVDAYAAAAFSYTNPLKARWGDPPRRTLDANIRQRLAKGGLALRYGLFGQARELSQQYQWMVRKLLGNDVVLLSPSAESIPTGKIVEGRAGTLLDSHDRITMAKNRIPEWGQLSLPSNQNPQVGIAFSGTLAGLSFLKYQRPMRRVQPETFQSIRPMKPLENPAGVATPNPIWMLIKDPDSEVRFSN